MVLRPYPWWCTHNVVPEGIFLSTVSIGFLGILIWYHMVVVWSLKMTLEDLWWSEASPNLLWSPVPYSEARKTKHGRHIALFKDNATVLTIVRALNLINQLSNAHNIKTQDRVITLDFHNCVKLSEIAGQSLFCWNMLSALKQTVVIRGLG
jgi:hypothetical protein